MILFFVCSPWYGVSQTMWVDRDVHSFYFVFFFYVRDIESVSEWYVDCFFGDRNSMSSESKCSKSALEKSVEWYTNHKSEPTQSFSARETTYFPGKPLPPHTSVGISITELRRHTLWRCAFCEDDNAEVIVANPFTVRFAALVCKKCYSF